MTSTTTCPVLVVDDLPENRLAMEAILAPLDLRVVLADSGRDALRFLMQQDFAVILLDVIMPAMSGFETAELIRARKRNVGTPIIFITALGTSETEMGRGYALGAVDYVSKPIAAEVLRSKVAVFVELYRMREDLQRQRDLLQAANRELEAFSYSVSHDLRAPLRHVQGFIELLKTHAAAQFDATSHRYMETITGASTRMGALIDDLLLFSRIGKTEMRLGTVDSNTLVRETIDNLETDLKDREIAWTIHPLPKVTGDATMLRQVWANLIDNAVKYTRTRARAEITIGATPQGTEEVFSVKDNGVGFDQQYAGNLFGVFQRLHRAEDFEGTGIGLANVRRIIARHGGRTWAEGVLDEGAAFYFSLPPQPGDPS